MPCQPADIHLRRESGEKVQTGDKAKPTNMNKGGKSKDHLHTTAPMTKNNAEPSSHLNATSEARRGTTPQHGESPLSEQQVLGSNHQPSIAPMDTREAAKDALLNNDPSSRDENNLTLTAAAVGRPPNAEPTSHRSTT
ncbi:unnamed protein product [Linum trigynum]|uniref:Uncharacterized protein n=1 Tax=Linum trigynum TaxID=586398 RepID=A0AAV2DXQ6_9ROSI